jgi:hypothetical protein
MVLELGDGIEKSRCTAVHSADTRNVLSDDAPSDGRHGARFPLLQEDLQRELDGAAAVEEAHGVVQIDVVARREDDRSLGVVPGPLERLVTPLLDSVALGNVD